MKKIACTILMAMVATTSATSMSYAKSRANGYEAVSVSNGAVEPKSFSAFFDPSATSNVLSQTGHQRDSESVHPAFGPITD